MFRTRESARRPTIFGVRQTSAGHGSNGLENDSVIAGIPPLFAPAARGGGSSAQSRASRASADPQPRPVSRNLAARTSVDQPSVAPCEAGEEMPTKQTVNDVPLINLHWREHDRYRFS
jgi:hypothetical protein